ncbi:MAG: hypothetical protein HKN77_03420 [Woeseiaceae bacterium]|nr:hypothetical protein [Woeseiaceae bacterium]
MAFLDPTLKQKLTRETALFVGLLFAGFVLLPIAIWIVGDSLFGDYGGGGFSAFFGALSAKVREFDNVAWFLILSPYLGVSVLRAMAWGWRAAAKV